MAVKLSRSLPMSFYPPYTESLAVLMAVFDRRQYIIKKDGPVSLAHFSSTEPAGQNPLQSCQTPGQTPLGTGDAGKHRDKEKTQC